MAMTNCRECGNEVSEDAKTCPHCGVKTPDQTSHYGNIGVWSIVAVIILVSVLFRGCSDAKLPDPEVLGSEYKVNISGSNTMDVTIVNKNSNSGVIEVEVRMYEIQAQLLPVARWKERFSIDGNDKGVFRVPLSGQSIFDSTKYSKTFVEAVHPD